MIPYFEVGPFHVGGLRIYPFGAMVASTLLTWLVIVIRRALRVDLDPRLALRLLEFIIVAGVAGAFVGAGLMNLLTPGPAHVRFSSFGGVFGSLAGVALCFRVTSIPRDCRWRYLDLLAYAFPFGWTFLRLGCTLVHDHPGRPTESPLAVQYPDGPRYDLGLLEMLVSFAVACIFAVLGRTPRPPGFFLRWMVICGPVRIVLGQLRENPARLHGLTADQIGGLALTAISIWIVWRAGFSKPAPTSSG